MHNQFLSRISWQAESSKLSSSSSMTRQSSSSSMRKFLGALWKAKDGLISDSLRFQVMVSNILFKYYGVFSLGLCSIGKCSMPLSGWQILANASDQGILLSISMPRVTAVSYVQHRDTFSIVYPPPPNKITGTPQPSMCFTAAAWPLIDRFKWPSLSLESESAPHCRTTTSGRYDPMHLSITFLNRSKQMLSVMPRLRGTFTAKYLPRPSPVESSDPVPGKKSYSNSWKLTVMTLLVLQKAYSTPSPWCTSMSRYNTLGYIFSSSRMHMTMSLMQQNPLASVFLAWWYPPAQFITTSDMPVITISAASRLPPTASWQKLYKPSKPGQSKDWLILYLALSLGSSLAFFRYYSLYTLMMSSFLGVIHFSKQVTQPGS